MFSPYIRVGLNAIRTSSASLFLKAVCEVNAEFLDCVCLFVCDVLKLCVTNITFTAVCVCVATLADVFGWKSFIW